MNINRCLDDQDRKIKEPDIFGKARETRNLQFYCEPQAFALVLTITELECHKTTT